MSLEQQMKTGKLYVEFGHASEEDQAYEKVIEGQRMRCKELLYDYNHTRPSDQDTKNRILKTLLAEVGESVWVEAPVQFSYGCNTHFGKFVYANFNLTIVDDCDVVIGAGSVVTHDIPNNSVAFGSPCRVVRPITETDKESYKKGFPLNEDWDR